jgi:hypothetical protein
LCAHGSHKYNTSFSVHTHSSTFELTRDFRFSCAGFFDEDMRVDMTGNGETMSVSCCVALTGRVVVAVVVHVPWRDAVLCQLLGRTIFETKVGAGTHTAVVVNVSPEYEDDPLCSLRFGEAVAGVSNNVAMASLHSLSTEDAREEYDDVSQRGM